MLKHYFFVVNHDKRGPKYVLEKLPKLVPRDQQEIMGYVQKEKSKLIQQRAREEKIEIVKIRLAQGLTRSFVQCVTVLSDTDMRNIKEGSC